LADLKHIESKYQPNMVFKQGRPRNRAPLVIPVYIQLLETDGKNKEEATA
jgi:hypothetical protein